MSLFYVGAMKVVIVLKHRFGLWSAPDWFLEKLRAEFPEDTFVYHHDYEGIEADLQDAEVVISWSLNGEQVKAAPRLRWIHSTAAAIHQLLIPEIVEQQDHAYQCAECAWTGCSGTRTGTDVRAGEAPADRVPHATAA